MSSGYPSIDRISDTSSSYLSFAVSQPSLAQPPLSSLQLNAEKLQLMQLLMMRHQQSTIISAPQHPLFYSPSSMQSTPTLNSFASTDLRSPMQLSRAKAETTTLLMHPSDHQQQQMRLNPIDCCRIDGIQQNGLNNLKFGLGDHPVPPFIPQDIPSLSFMQSKYAATTVTTTPPSLTNLSSSIFNNLFLPFPLAKQPIQNSITNNSTYVEFSDEDSIQVLEEDQDEVEEQEQNPKQSCSIIETQRHVALKQQHSSDSSSNCSSSSESKSEISIKPALQSLKSEIHKNTGNPTLLSTNKSFYPYSEAKIVDSIEQMKYLENIAGTPSNFNSIVAQLSQTPNRFDLVDSILKNSFVKGDHRSLLFGLGKVSVDCKNRIGYESSKRRPISLPQKNENIEDPLRDFHKLISLHPSSDRTLLSLYSSAVPKDIERSRSFGTVKISGTQIDVKKEEICNAVVPAKRSKYHNLTKLFMYFVLSQFSQPNMNRLNVPSFIQNELLKCVMNIKRTAKRKIKNRNLQKTDFFNHSHYNALFLHLDEQSLPHLRKKPKDIEVHMQTFRLDINAIDSLRLDYVNILKKFAFEIIVNTLQEPSEVECEDNPRNEYMLKALSGIRQLAQGHVVFRFQQVYVETKISDLPFNQKRKSLSTDENFIRIKSEK